jgi:hypothetical protein
MHLKCKTRDRRAPSRYRLASRVTTQRASANSKMTVRRMVAALWDLMGGGRDV